MSRLICVGLIFVFLTFGAVQFKGVTTEVKTVNLYFHFIVPKATSIQNYKEVLATQIALLNESMPNHRIRFVVAGYNIRVSERWYSQIAGSPILTEMRFEMNVPGAVNIYTIGDMSLIEGLLGEKMPNGDVLIYGQAPSMVVVHEVGHSLGLRHVSVYRGCSDVMNPIMMPDVCTQFSAIEEQQMVEYLGGY
jgi:putative effector of murein hydrolase LrgA (UPF0299 family)